MSTFEVPTTELSLVSDTLNNNDIYFTVDDALDVSGFGMFQYRLVALMGLFMTCDAMEVMLLSFLGPCIQCDWGITKEQEAMLTTSVFIGMMFGAWCFGNIADIIGRKKTLYLLAFSTLINSILSATSQNYMMLVIFRVLVGFCLGGFPVAFSYMIELCPSIYRGKLGVCMQIFWTIGTIFITCIVWIFLPITSWRFVLFIAALPILIVVSFISIIPESPRFLLVNNQVDEAYQILLNIAKLNKTTLPKGKLIINNYQTSNEEVSNYQHRNVLQVLWVLFSPGFRRSTILLWLIWFVNSFCYYGIAIMGTTSSLTSHDNHNITTIKNNTIFCNPNTNNPFVKDDYISIFINTISEIPGLFVGLIFIDTLGRRKSQAILFLISSFTLIFFTISIVKILDSISLFISRLCIYAAFNITYIYSTELYPTSIRTSAFGLANCFSRFGGMLAPFIGQDLVLRNMRSTSSFIFAICSFIACIAAFQLKIETSGKNLQDNFNIEDGLEMQITSSTGKHIRTEQGNYTTTNINNHNNEIYEQVVSL